MALRYTRPIVFDNDGEGSMGKLDARIAIVTGASRGIGKEIARLFAQEGARVVCAARTLNEGGLLPDLSPAAPVASCSVRG